MYSGRSPLPINEKVLEELKELDAYLTRRQRKFNKVLKLLEERMENTDAADKSFEEIGTYLRLMELTAKEIVEEEKGYKKWLMSLMLEPAGVSDETLERLREFRRRLSAENDDECVDELLNIFENQFLDEE
ncbi:hypothetical protein MUO93_01885 [Candidatus Bathyarchaeota archaeon]|nr:hypothetical protein [Candidatus Bathyarchaeota archaeon]